MSDRVDIYLAKERIKLRPAPIEAANVRTGAPRANASILWQSDDKTAATMIWECTAGTFAWQYPEEETVHILEGEVNVEVVGGKSFRLGAGDTAVFKAGAQTVWTVPNYVRKVAIIRWELPSTMTLVARGWRRVKRVTRSAVGRPQGAGLGLGEGAA